MNWIDKMLICYEREIAIILSVLLIAFNLASLYFIIDLLSYDEIVGYLADGGLKSSDPHDFVYVLLIPALCNILFVFTALCACFTNK